MLDTLEKKIRQMHASLGAMSTSDVLAVVPDVVETATYRSICVDFNKNSDPIELANAASLLIANIASLKDHLRAWCKLNGAVFHGEQLINTCKAAALVHDLWNIDKHGVLTSPPRSGCTPKIVGLRKVLSLSTGAEAGSTISYMIDQRTGQATVHTGGGGSATIRITGRIVDEHGSVQGDFFTTCTGAADEWARALNEAGINIR